MAKKPRMVWLSWVDSEHHGGGWQDREDITTGKRSEPMHAAGLVYDEGGDYITLTVTMHAGEVYAPLTIPKVAIIEMKELTARRK